MKSPTALFPLGLLCACLAGCATTGRVYDDNKVAMIRKDVTIEAELLEWFGPASSRALAPDGSRNVNWKFARKSHGASTAPGKLEVRLNADGKVTSYFAAASMK